MSGFGSSLGARKTFLAISIYVAGYLAVNTQSLGNLVSLMQSVR